MIDANKSGAMQTYWDMLVKSRSEENFAVFERENEHVCVAFEFEPQTSLLQQYYGQKSTTACGMNMKVEPQEFHYSSSRNLRTWQLIMSSSQVWSKLCAYAHLHGRHHKPWAIVGTLDGHKTTKE